MSVVSVVSVPSEVLILSDSRITFQSSSASPMDVQRKIFFLTKNIVVAFVSNDVYLTLKILQAVKNDIETNTLENDEVMLFKNLPTILIKHYQQETSVRYNPLMKFILATMNKNDTIDLNFVPIFELLKRFGQGSYSLPSQFANSMRTLSDGVIKLSPPNPLVKVLTLPTEEVLSLPVYGHYSIGSGQNVSEQIEIEFHKLFSYETQLRLAILSDIFDDYSHSGQVSSIGGLTQIAQIGYGGATFIEHSQYQVSDKGDLIKKNEITFDGNNWHFIDFTNNSNQIIMTNPMNVNEIGNILVADFTASDTIE